MRVKWSSSWCSILFSGIKSLIQNDLHEAYSNLSSVVTLRSGLWTVALRDIRWELSSSIISSACFVLLGSLTAFVSWWCWFRKLLFWFTAVDIHREHCKSKRCKIIVTVKTKPPFKRREAVKIFQLVIKLLEVKCCNIYISELWAWWRPTKIQPTQISSSIASHSLALGRGPERVSLNSLIRFLFSVRISLKLESALRDSTIPLRVVRPPAGLQLCIWASPRLEIDFGHRNRFRSFMYFFPSFFMSSRTAEEFVARHSTSSDYSNMVLKQQIFFRTVNIERKKSLHTQLRIL
jgi:hypothetical protein